MPTLTEEDKKSYKLALQQSKDVFIEKQKVLAIIGEILLEKDAENMFIVDTNETYSLKKIFNEISQLR
jgi:hypothetical protein